MIKMYYDNDCDMKVLAGKKIAVIGFGSQGHAHALNMKESGLDVVVGLRENSPSAEKAKQMGFEVMTPDKAAECAQLIMMLVPDEKAADIYKESIEANMNEGDALFFAHGFNIHYKQITPLKGCDVAMVAPKGPGHTVRSQYLEGKGVPGLIAIHQDATGKAREMALAYACAIGAGRAGILETTFKEETETD